MKNLLNKCKVAYSNVLNSEKGQGALEYIAIVFGLVVAVSIGFKVAGGDIQSTASSFVRNVIDGISP